MNPNGSGALQSIHAVSGVFDLWQADKSTRAITGKMWRDRNMLNSFSKPESCDEEIMMAQILDKALARGFAPDALTQRPAALMLILVLAGCQPVSHDWQQDIYIWQRSWGASSAQAVDGLSPEIVRHRILVGQWGAAGQSEFQLDLGPILEALPSRNVVPVLRLDGTRLPVSPRQALDRALEVITALRGAGVRVSALEVDHDTATAAVGDYAVWLQAVRDGLPADLALWVTTLPDWRHSPEITMLLASVDAYTLQVHAVLGNREGLMDMGLARQWVADFSALSNTGFFVALPTYQLRAGLDLAGGLRFLEAEAPVPARSADERFLFVSPAGLSEWVAALRRSRPDNLLGLAWFRLPIAEDRANISLGTLNALVEGRPIQAALELLAEPVRVGAMTYDLSWVNHGPHDAAWPAEVALPAGCSTGGGANGFQIDRSAEQLRHSRPGLLRPGDRIGAGWVRCVAGWPKGEE